MHARLYIFCYLAVLSCALLSVGCRRVPPPQKDDVVLARVYDQYLYASQLQGWLSDKMTTEDTILLNAYIENWAKSQLLRRVAEDNVTDQAAINRQVEAYRASLVQFYYEKALVEQTLDSAVAYAEVRDYYDNSPSDHITKESIARYFLVKMPADAPLVNQVQQYWQFKAATDLDNLRRLVPQATQSYMLEDSAWITKTALAAQLPPDAFNQGVWAAGKSWTAQYNDVAYFVKIHDLVGAGEKAPISAVKDEAIRYILHTRKLDLVKKAMEDMFVREQNKNNVELFSIVRKQ